MLASDGSYCAFAICPHQWHTPDLPVVPSKNKEPPGWDSRHFPVAWAKCISCKECHTVLLRMCFLWSLDKYYKSLLKVTGREACGQTHECQMQKLLQGKILCSVVNFFSCKMVTILTLSKGYFEKQLKHK